MTGDGDTVNKTDMVLASRKAYNLEWETDIKPKLPVFQHMRWAYGRGMREV